MIWPLLLGAAGAWAGAASGIAYGATIGWAIGSAIGTILEAPGSSRIRQFGPRITDFRLTSSKVGIPIPRGWTKERFAGNLIWAAEMEENIHVEKNCSSSGGFFGFGGGEQCSTVTTYSYQGRFAIAFCEVPAGTEGLISKMWANGRLIYSPNDGIPISSGQVRIYSGAADQGIDKEIQEHNADAPAYRYTVYAVFENWDMEDSGYTFPQVTAEVLFNPTTGHSNTAANQPGVPQSYGNRTLGQAHERFIYYLDSWTLWAFDPVTNQTPREWNLAAMAGNEYLPGYSTLVSRVIVDKHKRVHFSVRSTAVSNYYLVFDLWSRKLICKIAGAYDSDKTCFMWDDRRNLAWTIGFTGDVVVYQFTLYGYRPSNADIAGMVDYEDITPFIKWQPAIHPFGAAINGSQPVMDHNGDVWVVAGATMTHFVYEDRFEEQITLTGSSSYTRMVYSEHLRNLVIADNSGVIAEFDIATKSVIRSVNLSATIDNLSTGENFFSHDVLRDRYLRFVAGVNALTTFDLETFEVVESYTPGGISLGAAIWSPYSGCWTTMGGSGPYLVCNTLVSECTPLSTVITDLLTQYPSSEMPGLTAADLNVSELSGVCVKGLKLVNQTTTRDVLQFLRQAYTFDSVEFDGKLNFLARGRSSSATIYEDDLDAREPGASPSPTMTINRQEEIDIPKKLTVNYIEEESDYEQGSQYSVFTPTYATSTMEVTIPVVMSADDAATQALVLHKDVWQDREVATFKVGPKYCALTPTDVVTVSMDNGETYTIRLTSVNEGANGVVECQGALENVDLTSLTAQGESGDYGGPFVDRDDEFAMVVFGTTAFDLEDSPCLWVATCLYPGSLVTWSNVTYTWSAEDGTGSGSASSQADESLVGSVDMSDLLHWADMDDVIARTADTISEVTFTPFGTREPAVGSPTFFSLTNPGAESGSTTGWTVDTGTWTVATSSPAPQEGTYYFTITGATADAEMHQDVSVSSMATEIDAGGVRCGISVYFYAFSSGNDANEMKLTFYDGSLVSLGTATTGSINEDTSEWIQHSIIADVPANTRTIRVHLLGIRGGTSFNCYFDNISDLELAESTLTADILSGCTGLYWMDHEIVGIRDWVDNGDGTFTGSHIFRGMFGTDFAVRHDSVLGGGTDGYMALLELDSLTKIPLTVSSYSRAIRVTGKLPRSSVTQLIAYTNECMPLAPWAPWPASVAAGTGSDIDLDWTPRDRQSGDSCRLQAVTTSDDPDTFTVEVLDPSDGSVVNTYTDIAATSWTYTSAMQTTDFGAAVGLVAFRVYQQTHTGYPPLGFSTLLEYVASGSVEYTFTGETVYAAPANITPFDSPTYDANYYVFGNASAEASRMFRYRRWVYGSGADYRVSFDNFPGGGDVTIYSRFKCPRHYVTEEPFEWRLRGQTVRFDIVQWDQQTGTALLRYRAYKLDLSAQANEIRARFDWLPEQWHRMKIRVWGKDIAVWIWYDSDTEPTALSDAVLHTYWTWMPDIGDISLAFSPSTDETIDHDNIAFVPRGTSYTWPSITWTPTTYTVTNPDAETGDMTGWTDPSTAFAAVTSVTGHPAPIDTYMFAGTAPAVSTTYEMSQTFDVSSLGTNIDGTQCVANFESLVQAAYNSYGWPFVEFQDSGSAVIDYVFPLKKNTTSFTDPPLNEWDTGRIDRLPIPVNTRYIRVGGAVYQSPSTGASTDGVFDEFTDLVVETTSETAHTPAATSVTFSLTNPGAESGDLTGWTSSYGGVPGTTGTYHVADTADYNSTISPYDGTYLFRPNTSASSQDVYYYLYQNVSVSSESFRIARGGATVSWGVWCYATGGTDDDIRIGMQFRNSGGSTISTAYSATVNPSSWTYISIDDNGVPTTTASIRVFLESIRRRSTGDPLPLTEFDLCSDLVMRFED